MCIVVMCGPPLISGVTVRRAYTPLPPLRQRGNSGPLGRCGPFASGGLFGFGCGQDGIERRRHRIGPQFGAQRRVTQTARHQRQRL